MVVLIDGVKYKHLKPDSEATLEGQIEENHKHIFGDNSIYFPKKKIRSKAGIGTIPDAFIIIPDRKLRWCILEVELASHSVYDHVFPQLTKFRRAIENSSSRKKMRDFFYNTITEDPILEAQFRKQIGSGEIYKSISDMVEEKPMIVVAIDEKTDELGEALLDFGGDVKVIEFKTYRREGCSDEINAYVFEPIIISKKVPKITTFSPVEPEEKGKDPVMVEAGKKAAITRVTSTYTFDEHLKGKPEKIKTLALQIQDYILGLDSAIVENPKKMYVGYKTSQNIVCMLVKKSKLVLYLKLDPKKIEDMPSIAKDVTNIGHNGTGEFEVTIKNETDFEAAKHYIEMAYKRVGG